MHEMAILFSNEWNVVPDVRFPDSENQSCDNTVVNDLWGHNFVYDSRKVLSTIPLKEVCTGLDLITELLICRCLGNIIKTVLMSYKGTALCMIQERFGA